MSRRAVEVRLVGMVPRLFIGEPMLDTDDKVLIIQFEDGTYRTFNWRNVTDFYHMTEEETSDYINSRGNDS